MKRGILLGFRVGRIADMSLGGHHGEPKFGFFDKHTFPPQRLELLNGVRVVPGGSAVRRGAYLAPGVVCMPPMYVNVGAWVGTGTMVDSHALVGSCAQVGERVDAYYSDARLGRYGAIGEEGGADSLAGASVFFVTNSANREMNLTAMSLGRR